MRGSGQKVLVRVLAVEVNCVGRSIGKQRHRGEPAIDVGPGPPNGWDHAAQNCFGAISGNETTVDTRFVSAVTHDRRIGSTTDQQFDRIDQHCFACAGFARERGQTSAEHEFEAFDDAEVLNVEFGQHKTQYRKWVSQSCGPGRTFVRLMASSLLTGAPASGRRDRTSP